MAVLTVALHDQDKREAWEAEDAERRWAHYVRCEGTSRRHGRVVAQQEWAGKVAAGEVAMTPDRSTLGEFERAVAAHAKTLAALQDTARRLPPGRERQAAARMLVNGGLRKADVARLMGVTREGVYHLLAADDEIPF